MQDLIEQGIKLRSYHPGSYKSKCPNCEHTRKAKNKHDEPLSITIEPDGGYVFNCHNCGHSGGKGRPKSPTQREYRKPEPPAPSPSDKMHRWFAGRGINQATTDKMGIFRTERRIGGKEEPVIAFPYTIDGELANIKYRTADKRFTQEPGAQRSLYNIDSVKDRWFPDVSPDAIRISAGDPIKTVIFVEGEMDVLAVIEAGYSYVVSLPDGAPSEAKFDESDKRFEALNSHPWLMEAEKVILAGDMDGPGKALSDELIYRFGKDRCFRVSWPNLHDVECKDANETLVDHGPDIVRECIDLAEGFPIEGIVPFGGIRSELLKIYRGEHAKPLSIGFPGLDDIYKILPGTFHVVTGIPNHGKSNFVDQIMINMIRDHNWKFAIFSPEHSSAMHGRRIVEKLAMKPFDPGINERMTEAELESAIRRVEESIFFFESRESRPDIDWLLSKAKAACYRHGINGIIIDPYNEIDSARQSGKREDEHIRDLISACKKFIKYHDLTMWMVAHPAKMRRDDDGSYAVPTMYDISGAAHWNNMADVGLVIHRDFDNDQTHVITRKIREQGLYGSIGECAFRFDTGRREYTEIREQPQSSYRRDIDD